MGLCWLFGPFGPNILIIDSTGMSKHFKNDGTGIHLVISKQRKLKSYVWI